MAQNKISTGESYTYTVPDATTVTSGDLVAIGKFVGVALSSGVAGDEITVAAEGVFEVPKATGSGKALTQGQIVFKDGTNNRVTASSGSNGVNIPVGYVFESVGDSDTTVKVDLECLGTAAKAALATTTLTAIAPTYADLAAARTSVNTLRTDVDAALTNIKTALINAGLMSAS